jgi:D-alanine-D-alanine ligase
MQRIKVAILRGGPSSEYDVSLKTGKNVLNNLSDKYIPTDVIIDKKGSWFVDGISTSPQKISDSVDVFFNAMHGEYGEDGKVQQILDGFGAKYTGSKALASAIGMNKVLAKELFKQFGLKTPIFRVVRKDDDLQAVAKNIFGSFPMPAIVKPGGSGSSMGVSVVKTLKEIIPAIKDALKFSDVVIVEEFITGREATCGVVENFRNKSVYPLFPVEIIKPTKSVFFDYNAKYGGGTKEICPGNFTTKEKNTITQMAVDAHIALGLRHYSRSDFIINPKRGVYILEVNTLPGLTKESLLPQSLKAIGVSLSDFIDHVITLALNNK